MMDIVLTWVDPEGHEVSGDAVHGYLFTDYFRGDGLERARLLASQDHPVAALALLKKTYTGRDIDGIGLAWEIV